MCWCMGGAWRGACVYYLDLVMLDLGVGSGLDGADVEVDGVVSCEMEKYRKVYLKLF